MKRMSLILVSFVVMMAFFGSMGAALEMKGGDNYVIPADEVISDDLIAAAGNLVVDGKIDGDLIAAAGSIVINGEVTGDIILAGGNVTVNGIVGDDAIVASGSSEFNGPVGDNFLAASSVLVISDSSSIGRDAVVAGDLVDVRGDIDRALVVSGTNVMIDGDVGADAQVWAEQVTLGPDAKIGRNLNYTSKNEAVIDEGAVIDGEIIRNEPDVDRSQDGFDIAGFLMTFVTGMFIIGLFPEFVKKTALNLKDKPLVSGIVGFAGIFGAILLTVIFIVSFIGIPVGIIGFVLYVMLFMLSKIFAGVFVGRLILRQFSKNGSLYVDMGLGVLVINVLMLVPVISGLAWVFAYVFGNGALLIAVRESWKQARAKKIF